MDREKSVDGQELIRLINGHSERIKKCTITCATTVCCHCGLDAASGQTPFIFHGTRPRQISRTGWFLRLQSRCSSGALAMPSLPKDLHGLPAVCLPVQGVYLAADNRARRQVRQ